MDCPECGTELPVQERLSTWCHECAWNLAPRRETPEPGRLERAYVRAGNRLGRALVAELTDATAMEPRITPAIAAAYTISALVLAGTLAMAVGGLLLAVLGFPNPFALIAGVALGGLAVLMRPRFPRAPEGKEVTAAEAPALHAMARKIAEALGVEPPRRIVVDHEFNASWSTVGRRAVPTLGLGLPLLTALDADEQVALIAHEIGHGRNGDVRRLRVIAASLGALEALAGALEPDRGESSPSAWEWGPFADLVDGFLWLLSLPVIALLWLQYLLLMRDSQRAEFLADDLAARVAGTQAAVRMQEQALLAPVWEAVVRQSAIRSDGGDLFDQLREAIADVPERERERRRRVARLEEIRLELTHPPTGARIELLERRPARPAVVTASGAGLFDEELRPLRRRMAAEAVDQSAGLLYSGWRPDD
jgi:Zn-dependent protease with chaperone function